MYFSNRIKLLFIMFLTLTVLLSTAFQVLEVEEQAEKEEIEETEDASHDGSEDGNDDNYKEPDQDSEGTPDNDDKDSNETDEGNSNGNGNGKGAEMRNDRANQQQERREALSEAKSVSMEEFHRVREEFKAEAKKEVEDLEQEGDIDGAFLAQEELVELDLKDKNSYKNLGKLFDQRRGHGGTKVFVNGKHPQFDVPPVIRNGRTLIPLRAVLDSLNAEVGWDQAEQMVTVERDGVKIELYIGESTVYVNGNAMTLDVPAKLENNRTLVPLRFISEALSADVDWEEVSGSVVIVDKKGKISLENADLDEVESSEGNGSEDEGTASGGEDTSDGEDSDVGSEENEDDEDDEDGSVEE